MTETQAPEPLGPRTEAGRALLDAYFQPAGRERELLGGGGIERLVLAIEAEAVAQKVIKVHVAATPASSEGLDVLGRFRVAVDAAIENIAHGRPGAAIAGLRAARQADADAHPSLYEYRDALGNPSTNSLLPPRLRATDRLSSDTPKPEPGGTA